MKALTAGMLVVLTIVLSFIAYDLHRVANVLATTTGVGAASKPVTLAEHDARLRAEMKLLDHDAAIIFETPDTKKPQTARPSHK